MAESVSGVRAVSRVNCPNLMESFLVQAVFLKRRAFDSIVFDSVAHGVRSILTAGDRSWAIMTLKQTERVIGPCSWGVMVLLADVRPNLGNMVQNLTLGELRLTRA